MASFDIYVSVNITPAKDDQGYSRDPGMLSFSRRFLISGEKFADLAPKIDAVQDAIALLGDVEEIRD